LGGGKKRFAQCKRKPCVLLTMKRGGHERVVSIALRRTAPGASALAGGEIRWRCAWVPVPEQTKGCYRER
jgi:hypothetical protein